MKTDIDELGFLVNGHWHYFFFLSLTLLKGPRIWGKISGCQLNFKLFVFPCEDGMVYGSSIILLGICKGFLKIQNAQQWLQYSWLIWRFSLRFLMSWSVAHAWRDSKCLASFLLTNTIPELAQASRVWGGFQLFIFPLTSHYIFKKKIFFHFQLED